MAEHEFDFSRQITAAAMVRNKAQSDENRRIAEEALRNNVLWERAYNERGVALKSWQDSHTALTAKVAALEADLEAKRLQRLVESAKATGLGAELEQMRLAAANCSAMAPSGKYFTDGRVKSVARISFERAFDAYLLSNGVNDPLLHRFN